MISQKQIASLEDIYILPTKKITSWYPKDWPTNQIQPGVDSYFQLGRDYFSIGLSWRDISVSSVSFNQQGSLSASVISGVSTLPGEIIGGMSTYFVSDNIARRPVIISSQNSAFEAGVENAVILGGKNIRARYSNTVYVPSLYLQLQSTAPSLVSDTLYNLNGVLYFNGQPVGGSSSGGPGGLLPLGLEHETLRFDPNSAPNYWVSSGLLRNTGSQIQIAPPNTGQTDNTTLLLQSPGTLKIEGLSSSLGGLALIGPDGSLGLKPYATSLDVLNGLGQWVNITTLVANNTVLPAGLPDQTIRYDGSQWVGTSMLTIADVPGLVKVAAPSLSGISFRVLSSTAKGQVQLDYLGGIVNGLVKTDSTGILEKIDFTGSATQYLNGLGQWSNISDLTVSQGDLPPGVLGNTLRHDGIKWVVSNLLYNDEITVNIQAPDSTRPTLKVSTTGAGQEGLLQVDSLAGVKETFVRATQDGILERVEIGSNNLFLTADGDAIDISFEPQKFKQIIQSTGTILATDNIILVKPVPASACTLSVDYTNMAPGKMIWIVKSDTTVLTLQFDADEQMGPIVFPSGWLRLGFVWSGALPDKPTGMWYRII